MSETKFTKGEWKVSGASISCKGSGYIAKALPVYMDKQERTANAHLIAAAPEMYELLELAISYIDGDSIEDFIYNYKDIKKLLAKARGEQ